MLRLDDFQKTLLLLHSYKHGASYGGYLATNMIMSTLANRVRAGWGQWNDIIQGMPKASAYEDEPVVVYPVPWDVSFMRMLHEVDGIYDGSAKDLSNGALYWCDLRYVNRQWFKDNILKKPDVHPRVADMNSLAFFR